MQNVGKIHGKTVVIGFHALSRMVEMGLTPEEIKALILDPEEVYKSVKYPGDFCHKRGDHSLALTQDGDQLVVKTALYATMSGWLKANKAGLLGDGREVRMDLNIPKF